LRGLEFRVYAVQTAQEVKPPEGGTPNKNSRADYSTRLLPVTADL